MHPSYQPCFPACEYAWPTHHLSDFIPCFCTLCFSCRDFDSMRWEVETWWSSLLDVALLRRWVYVCTFTAVESHNSKHRRCQCRTSNISCLSNSIIHLCFRHLILYEELSFHVPVATWCNPSSSIRLYSLIQLCNPTPSIFSPVVPSLNPSNQTNPFTTTSAFSSL